MKQKSTFELVYDAVRQIPKGKVATYGDIAARIGNPRLSRVVGYALHVNPEPMTIPCHRVVNRFGEVSKAFAFGGENEQRKLLEQEGIEFDAEGRVDLEKYRW
ncbi:MAG: MGMT family protein [Ruminococcus sp.]